MRSATTMIILIITNCKLNNFFKEKISLQFHLLIYNKMNTPQSLIHSQDSISKKKNCIMKLK